ncbi:gluconokinase [Streptosporangium sp. NPDC048865]|uniref:gluconokinase n=1 Tax=Streptosporangium sp. NPDC048865 TaxID=3155766 RepID=UPI0034338D52
MNPAQDPAAPPPDAALLVVMGVTGSGKSTVGAALGRRLRLPFADADDFHSEANIAKMSDGIPLDDEDRLPWLRAIGAWLAEHATTGGVASCSALKRSYRDILREAAPTVTFVHLHGDMDAVRTRVAGRPGHFMPASLVESQFKTLEPLEPDERGIVLDFAEPVEALVDAYLAAATRQPPGGNHERGPGRDGEAGSAR